MTTRPILGFHAAHSPLSAPGKHARRYAALPRDVASLVRVVQGLVLHEFAASSYGVTVPDKRLFESHLRPIEAMLDRLLALDDRPLSVARPPDRRLVGVCRHFMLLLVSLLREKGIPARGRCGFAGYLNPGYHEDHWLCEYWNAGESRWILVDSQLDEVWRAGLKIDFDVLDVPRDRFLVAGDAWARCRAGDADPRRFGIFRGDLRGLWFVASDLVRDVAALGSRELLPWDVWGAAPGPDEPLAPDRLAFFDRLAALTRAPDASFDELAALREGDDRVRVPPRVFNAVRNRSESIDS